MAQLSQTLGNVTLAEIWIKEIIMIDDLIILALGGIAVCLIFSIAGAIAEWKDWK